MTTSTHESDDLSTGQLLAGHVVLVLLGPLNLAGGAVGAGGTVRWQSLAYAVVGSLIWSLICYGAAIVVSGLVG